MTKTENFAKVTVEHADDLRDWLSANHAQAASVWLVTYKKVVPDKYVDRDAVLDQLLCFGWVDGIRRVLDDTRTMQLISPRQTQAWSQSYKDRADRLESCGMMQEPGRIAIAASKANGMWDFYADVDALIVPDDLAAALAANPLRKQTGRRFPRQPPEYATTD